MKRLVWLAFAVVMPVSLLSCVNDGQRVAPSTNEEPIGASALAATPLVVELSEEAQPSGTMELPNATTNPEPTRSQPEAEPITEEVIQGATPVLITDGVSTPDISNRTWIWVSTTEDNTVFSANALRSFSLYYLSDHPVSNFRSECVDYSSSLGEGTNLGGLLFEMDRDTSCTTLEEADQWIERVSRNTTGIFLNGTELILEIEDGTAYMLFCEGPC